MAGALPVRALLSRYRSSATRINRTGKPGPHMKLLVTADLHIGRRCSKLPADVARDHAPVEMWRRIVDFAIEEQVDALLIAGDSGAILVAALDLHLHEVLRKAP